VFYWKLPSQFKCVSLYVRNSTIDFRIFSNASKNRKFPVFCIEGLELRQISRYNDYATCWATRHCGPTPSRTTRILSSPERHDPLWGPLCVINNELGGLFLPALSVSGVNPMSRLRMCEAVPLFRHWLQGV